MRAMDVIGAKPSHRPIITHIQQPRPSIRWFMYSLLTDLSCRDTHKKKMGLRYHIQK